MFWIFRSLCTYNWTNKFFTTKFSLFYIALGVFGIKFEFRRRLLEFMRMLNLFKHYYSWSYSSFSECYIMIRWTSACIAIPLHEYWRSPHSSIDARREATFLVNLTENCEAEPFSPALVLLFSAPAQGKNICSGSEKRRVKIC